MTAPKPTARPGHRTWVVKAPNGAGELVVDADYHRSVERRDGVELQFFNRGPEHDRRVATVRPGSWHWVSDETALPEEGDDA